MLLRVGSTAQDGYGQDHRASCCISVGIFAQSLSADQSRARRLDARFLALLSRCFCCLDTHVLAPLTRHPHLHRCVRFLDCKLHFHCLLFG